MGPRASVVISTLERTESLRITLSALRYQTFGEFEVIVVDGPARDSDTSSAVESLGWGVRYLRCPVQNLSRSRNIGIAASAGEIVAFIDDDAVPEPDWLERLVAAYEVPAVAGSGGIVYDDTGERLQYRFSLSDRTGETTFDLARPPPESRRPRADPLLYLQGTNMSFRRSVLADIGGFDEEIEYNYDEVEVCLQVLDRGLELQPLDGAAVIHRALPSRVRGSDRQLVDPYTTIKNRAYFALRHGTANRSEALVVTSLERYAEGLIAAGHAAGGETASEEPAWYEGRVRAGLGHGLQAARDGHRRSVSIPDPDPADWRPYARGTPRSGRRRVAVLDPDSAGQAVRLSAGGDEVHALHATPGPRRRDFEGGVWWHRYPVHDRHLEWLDSDPASAELYASAAACQELAMLDCPAGLDEIYVGGERSSADALRSRLAEQLAQHDHDDAEKLGQLLAPGTYPRNSAAELQRAWSNSPSEFIRAAYTAILDRLPATSEVQQWLAGADQPGWQLSVASLIAGSAEARGLRRPAAWHLALAAELEARAAAAVSPVPRRPGNGGGGLRRRLRRPGRLGGRSSP